MSTRSSSGIEARLAGAHAGAKAAATIHARHAEEYYTDLVPLIQDLRTAGKSLQEIANELNSKGHVTRRGKAWNPMQVGRVLQRAQK